jgi:hypothetical protein
MTTKRLFNENVKLITRSKKAKNRLIINNFWWKMLLRQHMRCREFSKYWLMKCAWSTCKRAISRKLFDALRSRMRSCIRICESQE